jgi:hypothetical protein
MFSDGQQMFFMMPDGSMVPGVPAELVYPQQDGPGVEMKQLNLPPDEHGEETPQSGNGSAQAAPTHSSPSAAEASRPSSRGKGGSVGGSPSLNAGAAEFRPSTHSTPSIGSKPTPQLSHKETPRTKGGSLSEAGTGRTKKRHPVENLVVPEDFPELMATDKRLQWTLPPSWITLSHYPKDFCVASPIFGLPRSAPFMQIIFYPNGSRTAAPGQCTVELKRGQGSAGLKFEVFVNGRSSGPKTCIGARYMGDFAKPFDGDCGYDEEPKVVIVMKILDVLADDDMAKGAC